MEKQEILDIIDSIEFNSQSEGCGLEDRNITDRYEAMEYGFERALDKLREYVN